MNTFKEGGNSIFWNKMQLEKEIKDSGKVLNIGKGTMTTRSGKRGFRTYSHGKASSATRIFAVSWTLK